MRYFLACGHEQFPPDVLLRVAQGAEAARFEGVCGSDHFQPWWEPGESGNVWPWLGAVAATTERISLGPAVTPAMQRYHPALVAQLLSTLEVLAPGRAFLGLGSGESLNESPLGMDWPEPREQLERLEEALGIILRLLEGERISARGRYPMKDAYLHTRPDRRPPIYLSAFHPGAAKLAGRMADGIWTLGDPESAPDLLDAYRGACDDAGREPGEILVQGTFGWAKSDDAAFEGAKVWKATQVMEYYTEDHHDPRAMQERGEREISDDDFRESAILSADPAVHVERIRELEELGATTVVLMNASGKDPEAAVRVYGDAVLPALRGARAAA